MSIDDKKKTEMVKAETTGQHKAPAGYVAVITDMPSFKAEPFSEREHGTDNQIYKGQPLHGEILAVRNFGAMTNADGSIQTNEDGETKDQIALVLSLLEETDVIDRDKKPRKGKVGENVLFFAPYQCKQAILAGINVSATGVADVDRALVARLNGRYGVNVWILPQKKGKHPTNPKYSMWSYKVEVDPRPIERKGIASLGQYFPESSDAPALPEASATGTSHVLPATNNARA